MRLNYPKQRQKTHLHIKKVIDGIELLIWTEHQRQTTKFEDSTNVLYKVLQRRVSQIQKRLISNNISHLYKITLAN